MAIVETTSCEKWEKIPVSLLQRKELMNSSRRKKTLTPLQDCRLFFNLKWRSGAGEGA